MATVRIVCLANYLTSGTGQLTFNMTNLRAGIKFYYFSGDKTAPIMQNSSTSIVNFENVNQPLRNRVVPTGNPNIYQLLWSANYSSTPTLRWGTSSGQYTETVTAQSFTITQDEMCGAPANSTGWRDLGTIYKATITGIVSESLANSNIYYIFGDEETDDFSNEVIFHVPPVAGSQPPTRATQIVLMADLGIGSSDSSADTEVWEETCPPAINTTMSVSALIAQGEVDAVFLSGDLSYANGYLSSWDFFLDMISPMSGSALYLTTVGNHESDWPDSASLNYGKASGGECGVCATKLIPMPSPATTNQPWWSYDIGIIHLVGMSTEHNFSYGSTQYNWLEHDLATVNRTLTPWVVFSGHRPMYVDSSNCCDNDDGNYVDDCQECGPGTDLGVMIQLQANIEPLLHQYRVNLGFAGHFHDMQRQAAVYQNTVVQSAEMIVDSEGHTVAYHDNPNATVWMVIGSAGNGPSYANTNYTWSEKYWDNTYGYAIVTAMNATMLSWQLINSANNQVIDRMIITQNFDSWIWADTDDKQPSTTDDQQTSNGDDDHVEGFTKTYFILLTVIGICVIIFLLSAFAKYVILPRLFKNGHGREEKAPLRVSHSHASAGRQTPENRLNNIL